MCANSVVTPMGDANQPSTFAPLANELIMPGPKRMVSESLLRQAIRGEGDFKQTIPTSVLKLDLFEEYHSFWRKGRKKNPVPNPTSYCTMRSLLFVSKWMSDGARVAERFQREGERRVPPLSMRQSVTFFPFRNAIESLLVLITGPQVSLSVDNNTKSGLVGIILLRCRVLLLGAS